MVLSKVSLRNYLSFKRGERTFAVERTGLQQIVSIGAIRSLPGAEAYCMGLVHWEDSLCALVDPLALLDLPRMNLRPPSLGFVVCDADNQVWIWAADSLTNVLPDLYDPIAMHLPNGWRMNSEAPSPHLLYMKVV